MKKLLILAACALGMNFSANAQMGIAPVIGLNMSNLSGGGESGDMKMGLHLGVLKSFNITDNFAIQPGVLYSMKGTKQTIDMGPLGSKDFSFTLSYIEIPINAVYTFGDGDGGFMVHAGPYLGYLLSAKLEDVSGTDGMKKIDFGANVGLGYKLPMGLFFRGQYGIGFGSIYEEGENVTNSNIAISVGYEF